MYIYNRYMKAILIILYLL